MKKNNHGLPGGVPELQALVLQQQATIGYLHDDLYSRKAEIDRLLLQLAKLRRLYFGSNSGEADRLTVQIEHHMEALQKEDAKKFVLADDLAMPPTLSPTPVRRPWPPHLPREERYLELPRSICQRCGGELTPMGESITEQLELINGAFKVIITRRQKRACDGCKAIVQAPSQPINRGIAGPGLLARVMIAKYAEQLPLDKLVEHFASQGVSLSRTTLVGWVGLCANLLSPLADAVCDYVMSTGKIHVQGTPVEVLQPDKSQPKIGRLWVYTRDDRDSGSHMPTAVWFSYSPDCKGAHPHLRLAVSGGGAQSDINAGVNALYAVSPSREAGAMAHTQRFIHAPQSDYQVPSAVRDNGGAGVHLTIAEEALRAVCIGQKIDLMMGSDGGGERAALLYTLIASCKLNGVEPEAYLRQVLATIADLPINKIKQLLPWNLAIPAD